MKAKIELTDAILDTIASEQVLENAYDLSVDCDGDMAQFYKQAFIEGMKFIINAVETK